MTTLAGFRVAAAQYDMGEFQSWDQYAAKLEQWTRTAVDGGAQLLVFPEYASMELVSLFHARTGANIADQLGELQHYNDAYIELHRDLSRQHQVFIVAGSFPLRLSATVFRNRAYIFSPRGDLAYQDKLHMTRYEAEHWGITPAEEVKVFQTMLGTFAVSICYDAEFPLPAQMQVEAGATVLIVPSCTDSLAGYHRVRIGCQARALENQCYVVQAATVGNAAWSEAVDVNVGAAGLFAPPDGDFPDTGVVTIGEMNKPGWVFGDIDHRRVDSVRVKGCVLNHQDRARQRHIANLQVERVVF